MSATLERERLRQLAAQAMLQALRRRHPEYRWIVAPHNPKPVLNRRTGT